MKCLCAGVAFAAALMLVSSASAQVLYSESFDTDVSTEWKLSANEAFGTSPADGLGDPDSAADFFFDYSTVGIPSAPNSTGNSTRGMKIQANLSTAIFGGASASPIGQNFTGDYKLTFDFWGNYIGDPTNGLATGGDGQTNMSTYGIMTDGDTGVVPGVQDAVWFGGMVDGFTTSDFRVYSVEREISYQIPADGTVLDPLGQPVDNHATYHAGSRNSSAALYSDNFGGVSAPQAQVDLFPQQHGVTPLGSLGMEWHEMEIAKIGNIVTWKVDDVLLITLDMTNFRRPTDGGNIFFGHSDINAGSSAEPDKFTLQFSLYDNVVVTALTAPPAINADFNDNQIVDAADYVVWRDNLGITTGALQSQGDADGDGDVDADDWGHWKATFGDAVPGAGSVVNNATTVPEPTTGLLLMLSGLFAAIAQRRR